jgi:diguanylate cyclase (GGDEF)-like protein
VYSILPLRIATIANLLLAASVVFILFFGAPPLYTASYESYYKIIAMATFTLTSVFSFFQGSWRYKSIVDNDRLTHELQFIASTDELTQLPNRRDMSARMEFEIKRAKRSKSEFSVMLADVDYFKKINDNLGHDVGDQVLTEFAKVFASRFRDTDKVGRWGGEEFLVILPDTQLQEAIKLANEVRKTISQTSLIPHMPNRLVTLSAGVASSVEIDENNDLLKVADQRLYQAKDSGRNKIMPETSSE